MKQNTCQYTLNGVLNIDLGKKPTNHLTFRTNLDIMNNQKQLLSEQVTPKNPSLQTQMKVSTLTSTHVALLSHGELSQAVHGAKIRGR